MEMLEQSRGVIIPIPLQSAVLISLQESASRTLKTERFKEELFDK
jgi:hypothetical protein